MKAIRKRDGTIEVTGVNEHGYYLHGIREIGTSTDEPGKHSSVWGWINHLREKNWWSAGMEHELIHEVSKLL